VLPRLAADTPAGAPRALTQAPAVPGRARYALAARWSAWRRRPSTVFCGHLYMAPLAALAARIAGARLVVQLHGIEGWDRPSPLRRKAVEAADLVLCVSRYSRARLLSWAAMAPERVAVLPNTVGEQFTPGDRAAARARFGFGPEKVILSVGRLDPRERYKGQDRVIAALPEIIAHGTDVLYVVAGEGADRSRLESLARETGVADRVRFLGAVPAAGLPDLYRAADLFALPSTGEGFGIVYLEAIACGTPALGLAEAGAVDALADGELGRACSEAELGTMLLEQAARPRGEGGWTRDVVLRFGSGPFRRRAAALVGAAGGTTSA
jgi:phosphatidylinositol alpha-1,6-mannosyltransferase